MGSTARDRSPAPGASDAAKAAEKPRVSRSLDGFSREGWNGALGLEVTAASAGEVTASWSVDERHLQPRGLVHGGVYASVVEACCSLGAYLAAPTGKAIVGVENHTSFLRPVRGGRLRARATPLHVGRRAQLWECQIVDEDDRLVATGRLRVMCLDEKPPEGSPT